MSKYSVKLHLNNGKVIDVNTNRLRTLRDVDNYAAEQLLVNRDAVVATVHDGNTEPCLRWWLKDDVVSR